MATASNIMKVTDKSLSAVSSILIDTYLYNSDITIVGSPLLSGNGVFSGFDSTSYLTKTDLIFKGTTSSEDPVTHELSYDYHPVKILISGNFAFSETTDTLFSIFGSSSKLSLTLNNTTSTIIFNNSPLVTLSNFNLGVGSTFYIELVILKDLISLSLTHNGKNYSVSAPIDTIDTSLFNSILVGIDEPDSTYFWKGSFNASKFFIYEDNGILYSPTEKESIKFTSIVISDPKYEITNSTTSFIGKSYEIPITEIARTNNHVLLKATISDKIYLNIGNIGLFCEIGGNRQLFSLITGLDLKKNSDLGYDLIFHVNTGVNVVNTEVLPDIVLRESGYITKTILEEFKKVFLNSDIDLERAIKKNAVQIGYNKPQVFYKSEQNNNFNISNWLKTSALVKCNPRPTAFFSFIPNTLHSYKVTNIANYNHLNVISVLDETFRSYNDPINFLGNNTLCVSTSFKDRSDKILVAKRDVQHDETIFTLSFINSNISFVFYTEENMYSISIPIIAEDHYKYANTFLISIAQDNDNFRIYANEELIGELTIGDTAFISTTADFSLTNYLDTYDINSTQLCVQDILFFEQTLSVQDLYYIKNLLAI